MFYTIYMLKKSFSLIFVLICLSIFSCYKIPEMTLEEIEMLVPAGTAELLAKTISKPWEGQPWKAGSVGGTWLSSITSDPKSFNLLIAERDAETNGILGHFHEYLVDYDYVKKEFRPQAASFRIEVDEENEKLSVYYTLRDDVYWSYYRKGTIERVMPVTSDDVIFWYNEIEGDPAFRSSAYNSQFVMLEDGSLAHIDIEKIDDKTFAFHFPRIDANPLLSTNRTFGPRFLYEKAKKTHGVKGVEDLLSINTKAEDIPSMGMWFLKEYTPGQRLVFVRNADYWNKDKNGNAIPYPVEKILQIVPDQNTQYLLFQQDKLEAYSPKPEELDEVVKNQKDYSVFSAGGSLGASMWSFNQNPKNKNSAYYEWFTQKEFRQAMSCLLHRDRIISQTYRGLAEPKLDFFPEANPYYNKDIQLDYVYNPERAKNLLAQIGITQNNQGLMFDKRGNKVEFDLTIVSDNSIANDIASIIADECKKIGIEVKIRTLDFQKVVEQLTGTYDWQSVIIGLGANYWPTQGSNVWPSDGNLHLWYPLQEKPATDWEARIDYLYNEGSFTIDKQKAQKIWDEYQSILLEECPMIYLVRPRSFFALKNRWDFDNFYYDTIGGSQVEHLYLKN